MKRGVPLGSAGLRRPSTQAEVKRFFERHPNFPRNKWGEVKQERVTKTLTNPIYAGYICSETYGIHYLKGQHEPLISLETFDKVQERRAGTAKAPKRANIGQEFALRGIVVCGCCKVPLRSSFSKGRNKLYPYYLCQTKGWEAYGKSIARDKVEGEVGEIIKQLQPKQSRLVMAAAMFKKVWEAQRAQSKDAIRVGKRQIAKLEAEIDSLLDRITETRNPSIIDRYEKKIAALELDQARITDKLAQNAEPKGSFEEKL